MKEQKQYDVGPLAGLDFLGQTCNALDGFYPLSDDNDPTMKQAIEGIEESEESRRSNDDLPDGVTKKGISQTDAGTASGSSTASYSKSLAIEAGVKVGYGAFTGSVDANFTEKVSNEMTQYYATILDSVITFSLKIDLDDVDTSHGEADKTKPFWLNQDLLDAFAELNCDDDGTDAISFFDTWGTHVICYTLAGGQATYSATGSSSDYTEEKDFNLAVQAKYSNISGSTSFSGSGSSVSDKEIKNVSEAATVRFRGGSAEAQSKAKEDHSSSSFRDWENSIPGNDVCIGFNKTGGLVLISDFCDDQKTQSYLEAVWNRLSGLDPILPSLDNQDLSTKKCKSGSENKNSEFCVYWDDKSGNERTQRWSASHAEVLVGFGGNINSHHHLNRMVCVTMNMETGAYQVYPDAEQMDYDETKWDAFFLAPPGHVITGLGVTQHEKSFYSLCVWYQKLNTWCLNPNKLLDGEVKVETCPKESARALDLTNMQKNWSAYGGGGEEKHQNRRAKPGNSGNQNIISGIDLHSSNTSKPNKGFDYMVFKRSIMRMPDF